MRSFQLPMKQALVCWACWSVRKRSWASVTRSTAPQIRVMSSSSSGQRSWRTKWATPFCIRFHARSKRSCGMKKHCLPTQTFFMRPPTTSWAFPRNCLHRSSFVRGCRAGVPMSWSSVKTTVSSAQVQITSARSRGQ